MVLSSFFLFCPEIYVFIGLLFYMISFFVERHYIFVFFLLIQTFIISFIHYLYFPFPLSFNWGFVLMSSNYIWFIKIFLVFFFILFLIVSFSYMHINFSQNKLKESLIYGLFEFLLIAYIYIFAAFIFISATDFLLVYIFLEIMSISLYILAAFSFESVRSAEASLKYFIFGAQFSGLFVLGWIFIYMVTGLSNFFDLQEFFMNFRMFFSFYEEHRGVIYTDYLLPQFRIIHLGFFFIFISFLAKLGLFPFHNWMIDVYDGASNLAVFFFSVFPKIVLFAFLLRFYISFYNIVAYGMFDILFLFSFMGSLFVGTITNLSQWRLKRFFVYSSLVNLGYILCFFTTSMTLFSFYDLILGVVFNLVIYVISIFLLFSVYLNVRAVRQVDVLGDMNELTVLKNNFPHLGLLFIFVMLSFAGVPPLMGFFGKYYLLVFLWMTDNPFLLGFVLFFSLIACFYYIRLGRIFFNFSSVHGLYHNPTRSFTVLMFILLFFQLFFIFYFMNFFVAFGDFLFLDFVQFT